MNTGNSEQNSDEVDLIQVFNSIGSRIKKLFVALYSVMSKLTLFVLYFSLRNYIVLIILLSISIGIKLSLNYFADYTEKVITVKEPTFKSNMLVKTNIISDQIIINYINKLKNLTKEENKSILMKELNIDSITASKIINIGAFWYIDEDNDGVADYIDFENKYFKATGDSVPTRIKNYFNIRLEYKVNLDISLISIKIIDYINNNSYYIKSNENRKKQLSESYNTIKSEIAEINTIREKYYKKKLNITPGKKTNQYFFSNDKQTIELNKIMLFHKQIFDFQNQSQLLQKEMEIYPDIVTVINGFTLSKTPIPSKVVSSNVVIKKGLSNKYPFFFLILGIISIFIFENRKKIVELRKKSKQQLL